MESGIEVRRGLKALRRGKNKKEAWYKYKHCHAVAMRLCRPRLILVIVMPR